MPNLLAVSTHIVIIFGIIPLNATKGCVKMMYKYGHIHIVCSIFLLVCTFVPPTCDPDHSAFHRTNTPKDVKFYTFCPRPCGFEKYMKKER